MTNRVLTYGYGKGVLWPEAKAPAPKTIKLEQEETGNRNSNGNSTHQGGRGDTKPDYYVSPAGDVIPSNRAEFEYNLSLMEENNGKYIGETSKGPVRVRIEGPHPMDENFNGDFDSDHFVDHFHIEHKKNGLTGQWGKGFKNKISMPMSWIGDD